MNARAESVRDLGEVSSADSAQSYAVAKVEVDIAWQDVEAATEPDAISEAFYRWWTARAALREVLIEAGAA